MHFPVPSTTRRRGPPGKPGVLPLQERSKDPALHQDGAGGGCKCREAAGILVMKSVEEAWRRGG
jgi:hypothetical protein